MIQYRKKDGTLGEIRSGSCKIYVGDDSFTIIRRIYGDSCEYIAGYNQLAHKGNCKYCKERRQLVKHINDFKILRQSLDIGKLALKILRKEYMILMKLNLIGVNGKCIINMKF